MARDRLFPHPPVVHSLINPNLEGHCTFFLPILLCNSQPWKGSVFSFFLRQGPGGGEIGKMPFPQQREWRTVSKTNYGEPGGGMYEYLVYPGTY